MWSDAVITNEGKELLAQWLNGGAFNLDSAATGQGTVSPSLLMGQTALVSKKQGMSIIKMEKVEGGIRVQLQLTSEGVTTGYVINQIGIWASLANGSSKLVAIYQDNTGITVPTHTEMPDFVFTFYATLQMDNEGDITVNIDTSAVATQADLNAEAQARASADTTEASARADGDAAVQKNLDDHEADTDNPHNVTQKQLLDDLTAESELADGDLLPFEDVSANSAKKISKANLRATLGLNTISMTGATITLGASLTYTGAQLTQAVSSVVVEGKTLTAGTDYIVSGNKGTNAGNYTLIVTGIGKYVGSAAKAWTIAKANGSASASPSSLSVFGAKGATRTVTISRSGDGTIDASSSAPEIATATVSGTTVTVRCVGTGSATIYISVAAGSNHKAATCSVSVSATILSSTLNDNTWAQIKQASDQNVGASLWSVGATKEIEVKGTVGTLSIDQKLWVFILGFNHNASYEGSNKIHFQGFKTAQSGGTDVGLVDSGYGSSYTDGTKYFNFNHWGNYNYGGWAAGDARYDILGSTNVAPSNYGSAKTSGATGSDATSTCATNPVTGTLMAALPSDLRAVMKPITKYTDNVGGGTGSVQANVTATIDYLPLLSVKEVFGNTQGIANSYEGNYQAQYTYYANGNSRIKYKHSAVTTAAVWLLRSPFCNAGNTVCAVTSSGGSNPDAAYNSRALAPAFAV